jgi:hypothetical protein
MRLTLRTLLAYLDDLLEPADSQELGNKIEESEFATNIVNRIHDCMRRLRLGVPDLSARGMGGDPNTVAEYLDNTMAPDLVPEFERICLESDMHLAEVAACHQILTLVLGEPAEVDSASRARMYRLVREPAESSIEMASSAPLAGPRQSARRRPEVPDYLRERESFHWKPIAAVLAVAVIVIALAALFWPRRGEVALAPGEKTPPANVPAEPAAADDHPAGEDRAADDEKTPESPTPMPADQKTGEATAEAPEPTAPADEDIGAANAAPPTADETASSDKTPEKGATPDEITSAIPPTQSQAEAPPHSQGEAESAPLAPTSGALGRYISEGQLLLRFQPPDDWLRLPARDSLLAGQRLVVLPDFRGDIALNSGVTLQLLGATAVELNYANSGSIPEINIDFGRLALLSSAHPNARIGIRLGDEVGVLTLNDPASVAGIEVVPVLPLGSDPASGEARRQAVLFVGKETVTWQNLGQANPQTLVAPAGYVLSGGESSGAVAPELPDWLMRETQLTDIERRAADVLAGAVSTWACWRTSIPWSPPWETPCSAAPGPSILAYCGSPWRAGPTWRPRCGRRSSGSIPIGPASCTACWRATLRSSSNRGPPRNWSIT